MFLQKYFPKIFVIIIFLIVILISTLSLILAIQWSFKPFVGFLFQENTLLSPIQRDEWDVARKGLKPGTRIKNVDGLDIHSGFQLREYIFEKKIGDKINFQFEESGENFSFALKEFKGTDILFVFVLPFVTGLICFIIGAVVYFLKERSAVTILQLSLWTILSIFYITLFERNTTYYLSPLWCFFPLIGPISLHLFTHFPYNNHWFRKYPLAIIIPYSIAIILILIRIFALKNASMSQVISFITAIFLTIIFVIDMAIHSVNYFLTTSNVIKNKIKILGVGLFFAAILGVVWSFAYNLRLGFVTFERVLLLSMIFPILFTYALLKYNLFDIDFFLRTTLTYTISSGLIVLLYVGSVVIVSAITMERFPLTKQTTLTIIILTLFVAILFHPLRVRVQKLFDRLFLKEKIDFKKTVTKFSEDILKITDYNSLLKTITDELTKLFHSKGSVFFGKIQDENVFMPLYMQGKFVCSNLTKLRENFINVLKESKSPVLKDDLLRKEVLDVESKEFLLKSEINIFLPLSIHNKLFGIVGLSKKTNDDVYTYAEMELLSAISKPASISLENAILYTERAKQERLATIGEFSSLIIHEIKNPLSIIKISAGALKKRFAGDDTVSELISTIEEEVERMNSTATQFLQFSKPEEIKKEKADIAAIIRKIIERFKIQFKNIDIIFEADKDSLDVFLDVQCFEKVLINLLLNAKNSINNEKGLIKVSLKSYEKSPDLIELSIEDNGKGMDEKTLSRIFEPFFSKTKGGTGLGLTIVQRIVKEHRGEIFVESEIGKGSKFTIILPR